MTTHDIKNIFQDITVFEDLFLLLTCYEKSSAFYEKTVRVRATVVLPFLGGFNYKILKICEK